MSENNAITTLFYLFSTMYAINEEHDLEYPASDTPMGSDDEVAGSDVANRMSSNSAKEPYEWTEKSLAEFKKYGMVPPLAMQHECKEESKVDEDLKGVYLSSKFL